MPTLARNLLAKPNKINFKGIAIGNPTFRQNGCASLRATKEMRCR